VSATGKVWQALVVLSARRAACVRRSLGWLPSRRAWPVVLKIGREKRFYAIFSRVLAKNGGIWYDFAQEERLQNGAAFEYALNGRQKHG